MNKWTAAIVLIIGLVGLIVLGKAFREDGGRGGDGDIPQTITVSGTATVSTAPDEAILGLGVRSEAPSADEAFASNGERVDAVTAVLIEAGVAEEDISTTNLQLNQKTINRGTKDEEKVYVAENRIEVQIKNLDDAGMIAGAAVGAGANIVGGIEFRLSDQVTSKEQALAKAIEGARTKAEAMAAAAGAEVGEVQVIDETNSEFAPYQTNLYEQSSRSADAIASKYSVSPGEVETSVTVTVVWLLEPGED